MATVQITQLWARPLIHSGWNDHYSDHPEFQEQCSTCQIFNFRNVHSFKRFRRELIEVMLEYRTGVCVIWGYWYFRLLKFWFWRWKVVRVCRTGGGGTLWVIKKRIWIK